MDLEVTSSDDGTSHFIELGGKCCLESLSKFFIITIFKLFLLPNFLFFIIFYFLLLHNFYFCYVYKESELNLILVIFKET